MLDLYRAIELYLAALGFTALSAGVIFAALFGAMRWFGESWIASKFSEHLEAFSNAKSNMSNFRSTPLWIVLLNCISANSKPYQRHPLRNFCHRNLCFRSVIRKPPQNPRVARVGKPEGSQLGKENYGFALLYAMVNPTGLFKSNLEAVINGLRTAAQIAGLLVQKREIGGPGAFARTTDAELADALLVQCKAIGLSEGTLEEIRTSVIAS